MTLILIVILIVALAVGAALYFRAQAARYRDDARAERARAEGAEMTVYALNHTAMAVEKTEERQREEKIVSDDHLARGIRDHFDTDA